MEKAINEKAWDVLWRNDIIPAERIVFMCISQYAKKENGMLITDITRTELVEMTGLGLSTVQRSLFNLRDKGLITIIKKTFNKNLYKIN